MGSRLIGRTMVFGTIYGGSSPSSPSYAALAQLAEHLFCNQKVVGSSPMGGSYVR